MREKKVAKNTNTKKCCTCFRLACAADMADIMSEHEHHRGDNMLTCC